MKIEDILKDYPHLELNKGWNLPQSTAMAHVKQVKFAKFAVNISRTDG